MWRIVAAVIVVITFSIVIYVLLRSRSSQVFAISFNGNLKAAGGQEPKVSFRPIYSDLLNRKVLRLLPSQQISYKINFPNLHEGSIGFWLKADILPPENAVRFLTLAAASGTPQMELRLKKRTIQISMNGKLLRSDPGIVSPGAWIFVCALWKQADIRLLINGKDVPVHPVNGRETPQSFPKGKLQVECQTDRSDFSLRLRDFQLRNAKQVITPADMNSRERIRWSTTDLYHFAGRKISDATASDGQAFTGDPELCMSDAVKLPAPGKYELVWRIKALRKLSGNELASHVYSGNSILAFRINSNEDLQKDKYQDFTFDFAVSGSSPISFDLQSFAPLKYSFLADSVTVRALSGNWQIHKQVEDLHQKMGTLRSDQEAEGGKAVDNETTLTYGPYICIGQPGLYRATWRIKIASRLPDQFPVLFLDIFAHDGFLGDSKRGNKTYAELALNTNSFSKRDTWETKALEFHYDGADMMEFRTFTRVFEPGAVMLDTITVEREELQ